MAQGPVKKKLGHFSQKQADYFGAQTVIYGPDRKGEEISCF